MRCRTQREGTVLSDTHPAASRRSGHSDCHTRPLASAPLEGTRPPLIPEGHFSLLFAFCPCFLPYFFDPQSAVETALVPRNADRDGQQSGSESHKSSTATSLPY